MRINKKQRYEEYRKTLKFAPDDFEYTANKGKSWNTKGQKLYNFNDISTLNFHEISFDMKSEIWSKNGTSSHDDISGVHSLRAFRRYIKKHSRYLPKGLRFILCSRFVKCKEIILKTK